MLSENGAESFSKACVWIGLEDDSLFSIRKNPAVKVVLSGSEEEFQRG
jgi:hypothetical protein